MEAIPEVYFNARQIEFATAKQKIRVWIGGRGSGKSAGLALIIRRCVEELPRGKYLFASTTLEQILNSTLPPVLKKLEELGFVDGLHFVVGKRPPDWFKTPFSPPKDYDNVLTFFNGFSLVFVSTAKPAGKRGGSYDGAIVDEAAFVKATTFKKVIVPMVRDNLGKYDSDLHQCIFLLTSQPTTADGHFVMEFEKEHLADPNQVLFLWTSARDNELVLGSEWFDLMRSTMGYSEYLSEVENVRQRKLPKSYYHTFDRDRHGYTKSPDAFARRKDDLIEVVWDFSGHFNCASVWQEYKGVEYCIGRFHTKLGEKKALGVVDKIVKAYSDHRFRYVRLWGEPRGKDDNPYSDDDLYTSIQRHFEAASWHTEQKIASGKQAQRHKQRHFLFEKIFNESEPTYPRIRISLTDAEDVAIAIEKTGILPTFQKDKSMEGSDQFPQEWAPHYTDGMDNYIDQKYGWRFSNRNEQPGNYDFL